MSEPEGAAPARSGWTADRIALVILGALIVVAVVVRVLAAIAWWPISPQLADSWPYAAYAAGDQFADPQHPAGYSLWLSLVGLFTRDVAVYGVLQQLLGIASGVILYDGVRRLCGSPWPGLLGAATILLGADQMFLERTIMSETLFTFLVTLTIYATARALETPERWRPWPLLAAAFCILAGITRSGALLLLPLIALALVLTAPRPWLARWRPVAAFSALAVVGLLAFGTANDISHDRFEFGPTPGWHLYARTAPVADCTQFEPPAGTAALCQYNGREQRMGADWYLYAPKSPATELFGQLGVTGGAGDAKLEAFAREVILHEPRAYLASVWPDIRAYFFPDDYEYRLGNGTDLDGQLNWNAPDYPTNEAITIKGMEGFFSPFSTERHFGIADFLHDYQRVFRFGGTALTIATLLTLIGLCLGRRRERIALMLLGIGGLAIFLIPTFTIVYSGRYSVPSAGPLAAAAAIGAMATWRRLRPGRSAAPDRPSPESHPA